MPLRDDDLLLLRGADSYDPRALVRALEPTGFSAYVGSRTAIGEAELQRLLVSKGVSYLWQLAPLREAVLPPTTDADRAPLLRVLGDMIGNLEATLDFIVADRYLLPKGSVRPDYVTELATLLESVASRVDRLRLVTGRFDTMLLRELVVALADRCPTCTVSHVASDRYHDRFWIADQARGFSIRSPLKKKNLEPGGCHQERRPHGAGAGGGARDASARRALRWTCTTTHPGFAASRATFEGVARFTKMHGSLDWVSVGKTVRRKCEPPPSPEPLAATHRSAAVQSRRVHLLVRREQHHLPRASE